MHWRLPIAIALLIPACSFDSSNSAGVPGADANSSPDGMTEVDASHDASLQNQTPTISKVVDQTTLQDPVGPIAFIIGDVDDDLATLVVTATSSDQTIVPNANLTLSGSGENRSVTLTPLRSGEAIITLQVSDGNTSAFSNFGFSVTNSPPDTLADNYSAFGNTELSIPAITGLLANDTDVDGDTVVVVATSLVSAMGAAVTLSSDGSFTYLPPVGIINVSDSFDYQVFDGFEGGTGTVAITIEDSELVWYVNNTNAGAGDGRSTDPFKSLADAESASAAGDVIFVYEGDGTSSEMSDGIVLKNNQRLLGETVGLTLNGQEIVPLPLMTVSPRITNGSGNGITLAANSVVKGVIVEDTSAAGILGVAASSIEITDVQVLRSNNNAIDIVATPAATSTLTIDRVMIAGNGTNFSTVPIGIDIDVNGNNGGQLLCTIDNTQINGAVVGTKIRVRGNTGTVVGANSFAVSNLTVDRVNDDAVQLEVDGSSINSFSFIGATIDGQDNVNNASPNRAFDIDYKAGTGSATSLEIIDSTITDFQNACVDTTATTNSNAGVLTALVRNNNISDCNERALKFSPDDEVTYLLTVDNNTMTTNGARSQFTFGGGTGHQISLNLTDNEDDQGFSLTRHSQGVLNLGGDIGQGNSFDDDNGNIADKGNTTNAAAPSVNIATSGGSPQQINIVNPATIPEP